MAEFKILWIDDDVNGPELMSDREALKERDCIVTPITNPDELQFDTISSFDCIIMDLFMPPGKKLDIHESRGGARTGFILLKKIKDKYPNSKTVIYTVFEIPEVKKYCNDMTIEYWNKSGYDADEFANSVIELVKGK